MQKLSDDELNRICVLMVLLSFGQCRIDVLDTEQSLFNVVAADLDLAMRKWWTPDAEFLTQLRKDQLEAVAIECNASLRLGKFQSYGKKALVEALAQYFAPTADPATALDEHDEKGRIWIPGIMRFPARQAVNASE